MRKLSKTFLIEKAVPKAWKDANVIPMPKNVCPRMDQTSSLTIII